MFKMTVIVAIFIILLIAAVSVYDASKDPMFHTCTQQCAMYGCPTDVD